VVIHTLNVSKIKHAVVCRLSPKIANEKTGI